MLLEQFSSGCNKILSEILRLLTCAVFVGVLCGACVTDISRDNVPELPVRFEDTRLPNIEINGYLYICIEDGLQVDVLRLIPFVKNNEPSSFVSKANSIAIWVGPNPKSLGLSINLENAAQSILVEKILRIEYGSEIDVVRDKNNLYVMYGRNNWTHELQNAIKNEDYVELEEAYTDVGILFNLLPDASTSRPIAAGFGILNDEFVANLEHSFDVDLSVVRSAVNGAHLQNVVFAMYPDESLYPVMDFDRLFLQDGKMGLILASRSSYPGFIISLMFKSITQSVGMYKLSFEDDIDDEEMYYFAPQNNLHGILKNDGSIFILSIAREFEQAKRLMLSVLKL